MSSWAIKDGRCYYRNRYVRTDAFMAEQEAGRMLFKGAFSRGDPAGERAVPPLLEHPLSQHSHELEDLELTLMESIVCMHCSPGAAPVGMMCGLYIGGGFFNPFNLEIKQIANTNVLHWAGRIFALHEVTLPIPCDVFFG